MWHRSRREESVLRRRSAYKSALWTVTALAAVVSACGGQAFSEEVPTGSVEARAELNESTAAPEAGAEGRWMASAYVADRPGTTAELDDELEREEGSKRPELTPRNPEPESAPASESLPLMATDTDGRQVVEFEAELPTDELPSEHASSEDASSEFEAGFDAEDEPSDGFDDAVVDADYAPEPEPLPLPEVAAGDEMVFAIEAGLSTEDALPGDIFYATLVDDVVASDGMVLLPRGVRARGRVLESLASRDSEELPVLEITLEELIGAVADTPIEATVVDAEYIEETRDSDGESVVKVLTGAAAGAILGKILGGDDEDALKGGIAGAAAGAAVAYGTRGGHAKLPAGALITIRLDRPLVVP